jgi:demethylmenaquinone methyltransferase / 2-methoxy-6-polyprenyl-1,4-benzoquinol methylase
MENFGAHRPGESSNGAEAEHSRAVREMFSGIAGKYDLLNHLLSLNIDKGWRRRVRGRLAEILGHEDATILDVACGTGDLSLELKKGAAARIIGTDFCRPMLAIAAGKSANGAIQYVEADAMSLPFSEKNFDAVTIAFGLRNLPNVDNGLRELARILKPGGRLVVLEFSSPVVPGFRQLFNFYFGQILPRIGGLVSGSRAAYTYLPASVAKFPDQKALAVRLEAVGLEQVEYENLTGGIAAIHTGTKR